MTEPFQLHRRHFNLPGARISLIELDRAVLTPFVLLVVVEILRDLQLLCLYRGNILKATLLTSFLSLLLNHSLYRCWQMTDITLSILIESLQEIVIIIVTVNDTLH